MSKKKRTIEGTRFQCTGCNGKGSYFVATKKAGESGTDAMNRLRDRVSEHARKGSEHWMILPVNPPKGFFYVTAGTSDMVGEVYDGKDLGKWLTEMKSQLRNTNSEPSWELK